MKCRDLWAASRLFGLPLAYYFLRGAQGVHAGRYAGIHRTVQQGFAGFLNAAAIVQGTTDVALEFPQAFQRGQGEPAAGRARQAFACPYATPGIFIAVVAAGLF